MKKDAYDVMIHKRIYQQAISPEKAIKELKICSGTQFDPEMVNTFVDEVVSLNSAVMI